MAFTKFLPESAPTKKSLSDAAILRAYNVRIAAIKSKITKLQKLVDNNFGDDLSAINYGHVGSLGRIDDSLDELLSNS